MIQLVPWQRIGLLDLKRKEIKQLKCEILKNIHALQKEIT
jgi:hypothetical protein